MSTRPGLNVTTTQRMALNTGLVTAIQTLRADALGLTRYLEEAAAANPALVLLTPLIQPGGTRPGCCSLPQSDGACDGIY
jgi:RNA polymerase sigma-54 factor